MTLTVRNQLKACIQVVVYGFDMKVQQKEMLCAYTTDKGKAGKAKQGVAKTTIKDCGTFVEIVHNKTVLWGYKPLKGIGATMVLKYDKDTKEPILHINNTVGRSATVLLKIH